MNPNEVSEYLSEALKWLVMGGAVLITPDLLSMGKALVSKRINSQTELENIVSEEKERLGMNFHVDAYLHNRTVGVAIRYPEGAYEIHVGGLAARRSVVKHELYHIYRGDLKETTRSPLVDLLHSILIRESRAHLYELTGIRF